MEPSSEAADQSDGDLSAVLVRAGGGDARAWDTIVRLYARRIYAAARSHLGQAEASEEVTQSVLATVYESISTGRYTDTGRFESWLFRIAMNRVRDVARNRARDRRLLSGLSRGHPLRLVQPHSDEHADTALELERLHAAVQDLGEADREILSLRHHAGLAFPLIAELLHAPLGTVLARHHRALAKLRTVLAPEQQEAQR